MILNSIATFCRFLLSVALIVFVFGGSPGILNPPLHTVVKTFEWKETFIAWWLYTSFAALLQLNEYKLFLESDLKLLHSEGKVEILFSFSYDVATEVPANYLHSQRIAFCHDRERDRIWKEINLEKSIISFSNEKYALANINRNFANFVHDVSDDEDDLKDTLISISKASSILIEIIDQIIFNACEASKRNFFSTFSHIVQEQIEKADFDTRILIENYLSRYLWPYLTSSFGSITCADDCLCIDSNVLKRSCWTGRDLLIPLINPFDQRQLPKLVRNWVVAAFLFLFLIATFCF